MKMYSEIASFNAVNMLMQFQMLYDENAFRSHIFGENYHFHVVSHAYEVMKMHSNIHHRM